MRSFAYQVLVQTGDARNLTVEQIKSIDLFLLKRIVGEMFGKAPRPSRIGLRFYVERKSVLSKILFDDKPESVENLPILTP